MSINGFKTHELLTKITEKSKLNEFYGLVT